eukprot:15345074-Ditylum_brightwellii.AAC.1
MIKRVKELAIADGGDGNIIFTNRAGTRIADIKVSDKYEDCPANANLTGVALQMVQGHQKW